METQPLIHWPEPLVEYAGFVASFLASGAVGFRFAVLGRVGGVGRPGEHGRALDSMAARAAWLGLIGALVSLVLLGLALPGLAARRHLTLPQVVVGSPVIVLQIAALVAAFAGFVLALRGVAAGWILAGLSVVGLALRAGFVGQWARIVNPVHVLAGGMWIGTLFVLATVGLPLANGADVAPGRRADLSAALVRAFSPLALASAGLLAVFGVITAWTHLKYLAALWSTPYGVTLLIKLCVVAMVAALGGWNWRRQRPRMGTDEGTRSLRRSARAELLVANIVLLVTALLVSLPTPELPGK